MEGRTTKVGNHEEINKDSGDLKEELAVQNLDTECSKVAKIKDKCRASPRAVINTITESVHPDKPSTSRQEKIGVVGDGKRPKRVVKHPDRGV